MKTLHFVGWMGAAIVLPVSLAGCIGGKGSSQNPPGKSQAAITKVSPSSVTSGSVPACAAGQAHRNVCCNAGPKAPSECGVYEDEPFHSCDTGAKTYPDPTTCCDLNDPSSCQAPPPVAIDAGPPVGCGYFCPPGWYASGSACCSVDPSGNGVCYATVSGYGGGGTIGYGGGGVSVGSSGNSGGTSTAPSGPPEAIDGGTPCDPKTDPTCGTPPPPPPPDAGIPCDPKTDPTCGMPPPPPPPDAGVPCDPKTDPTCAPPPPPIDAGTCDPMVDPSCCIYNGPDQPAGPPILQDGGNVCIGPVPTPPPPWPPAPPPCNVSCPDGWQQPIGEPDLCCRTDADGTIACFSQAVGPIGGPISGGGPALPPPPGDVFDAGVTLVNGGGVK